jgi:DNA-binding NarL/FixJ family response regulator
MSRPLGRSSRVAGDASGRTLWPVSARVLIADDHPVFRAGLRALIEQSGDLTFAGEAQNADEAVDKAGMLRPDVVVLDLRMPGGGLSATRRIAAAVPSAGILLLTMHDDEESVLAAMRAGARGYVLKGAHEDDIVRAIRAVASGEAIFGAAVADLLLDLFADAPPAAERAFPDLTDREREILELLAHGSSNGQIAQRLDLAPKTVRNHVARICNKLQVLDRAQAALRAREAGLGRQPA